MRTVTQASEVAGIRVDWRAGRDGVGHAHVRGPGVVRAACGRFAINPRFAWPVRARCADCEAVLPMSESEKRASWGDR